MFVFRCLSHLFPDFVIRYVLVPNARVNLAVNKKKGNLRAYLQDLKEDDSRGLERWFYRCVQIPRSVCSTIALAQHDLSKLLPLPTLPGWHTQMT